MNVFFYFPQITKVVVGLATAEFLALITAIVFTILDPQNISYPILHLIYRIEEIVAICFCLVFFYKKDGDSRKSTGSKRLSTAPNRHESKLVEAKVEMPTDQKRDAEPSDSEIVKTEVAKTTTK